MQFDFGVTPQASSGAPPPPDLATELLRQMLEVQKDVLAAQRMMLAAMDHNARWRMLFNRWREEFPGLTALAKDAVPVLEKTYGNMLNNLFEELRDKGAEGLENEFALQDFLDRYGGRLAQMSQLLNLVAPLAEFAKQNEAPPK